MGSSIFGIDDRKRRCVHPYLRGNDSPYGCWYLTEAYVDGEFRISSVETPWTRSG